MSGRVYKRPVVGFRKKRHINDLCERHRELGGKIRLGKVEAQKVTKKIGTWVRKKLT